MKPPKNGHCRTKARAKCPVSGGRTVPAKSLSSREAPIFLGFCLFPSVGLIIRVVNGYYRGAGLACMRCASSTWIFRICAVSTAPFTPLELPSNWLASPCVRRYRLHGGASLPRLLPSLCPARLRSPEARSAATAVGRQKPRSSHVPAMGLEQTEVGCGQTPLMQQHPRVQGVLLTP
jgi:hypothetical protein